MGSTGSGSIIGSPLFRRFLAPILLTMMAFSIAVYLIAVPYLKNLVYSLEEKAVRSNIGNIQKLLESNYFAIEAHKRSVTEAHRRQLKNVTLFMETYLKNKIQQVQQGVISEDEAQWSALEELRAFRYGNNDYVWVADYNGYYLAHPDQRMNMEDYSGVRDIFGNYVLLPLIRSAMEQGEGYHTFWWQRLEDDLPAEKLEYARLVPQWEWVIGTGVYLDDLEAEILMRKEKMIEELRQILQKITIAETGYMYVFDSWQNIIIHPNRDLENTDISTLVDPNTGKKLVEELQAAAASGHSEVSYHWDHPNDPGNYVYGKIDWVSRVEGFDWYIVASVYTDELNASSVLLRNKILFFAAVVVLLSVLMVSMLMGRLLRPVRSLSFVARRVEEGDLTAHCEVQGGDEIGLLAKAFNSMISQVRSHIRELDQKVAERTLELNKANADLTGMVAKLEQHNQEITQLNRMGEKLQACHSVEETYQVVAESLSLLFPKMAGALFIGRPDSEEMLPVTSWGESYPWLPRLSPGQCQALLTGRIHFSGGRDESPCVHIRVRPSEANHSICLPLSRQHEVFGLIHLLPEPGNRLEGESENLLKLCTTVSDHLSMAMANLRLRENLEYLSVRDGLTGLFNRRYMEETLAREFEQTFRSRGMIGVIILDVDFFKKFNDNYGHKAGDLVLIELGKLLCRNVRKGDVVCRYGGEEFVIILPGQSADAAVERARVLCDRTEKELLLQYQEHALRVTISLGVAVYPVHGQTPEELLKAADAALYRAKAGGRNQAVVAEAPDGVQQQLNNAP